MSDPLYQGLMLIIKCGFSFYFSLTGKSEYFSFLSYSEVNSIQVRFHIFTSIPFNTVQIIVRINLCFR